MDAATDIATDGRLTRKTLAAEQGRSPSSSRSSNEAPNVAELLRRLTAVPSLAVDHEILLVDDGPDATWAGIAAAAARPGVRGLRLSRISA